MCAETPEIYFRCRDPLVARAVLAAGTEATTYGLPNLSSGGSATAANNGSSP